VIKTSDDIISQEDAACGYKGLMVIEHCFRSLKRIQIKLTTMQGARTIGSHGTTPIVRSSGSISSRVLTSVPPRRVFLPRGLCAR